MIYIKELFPNPAGKDTAGEWIKLFNDGSETVNLSGWSLKDTSGKTFRFPGQTLSSNQEIQLNYQATRINLNNDGDAITLYNTEGQKIDELNYSQAGEEEIISSSKIAPRPETQQSVDASPLTAQAVGSGIISAATISPLLIALGLALAFGIGTAILTKKLLEI